ncbi:DUF4185 domain-containing protein [Candidatus Micrarchaeota archaeon]|nr:DUF4185 domain-containing protein [Candidatus Micrarchaeota archaeon]
MANKSIILILVLFMFFGCIEEPINCGNGICEYYEGENIGSCQADCKGEPIITSAKIVGEPVFQPKFGDLWFNTWADDDNVYASWGDGTGRMNCLPTVIPIENTCPMSAPCGNFDACPFQTLFCNQVDCQECYESCNVSDAGLVVMSGNAPYFDNCQDKCIVSVDVPSGIPVDFLRNQGDRNDKPSSLLFYNGTLYWAGHSPAESPEFGYIAYSNDYGKTWTEVENSPWAGDSVFKILMFINMGKDYELNEDGYVYAFGIGSEIDWHERKVYLARVPKTSIANYNAYEYYTGLENEEPVWSGNQDDAEAVEGIETFLIASSMYHEGTGRYVFLTALPDGGLFEAPNPWGPWTKIASLFESGDNPSWKEGAYMPGVISKDTGSDYFYFTAAGAVLGERDRYRMHIGKIVLETE